MMRRGRPGLVGTVARTAVIAGTATAVTKGVSNKMNASAEQKQQAAQQQQEAAAQQAQQQAAPPEDPSNDDVVEQLQKLAALKDAGALSDEEFASAKAKLLS